VFTVPRLMYLLRTAPCTDSPVLPFFDATIRDPLSAMLNVELSDDIWTQASLLVRWDGLRVRSVVLLALSVYLASAASTVELTSRLPPARHRDIEDSGTAIALSPTAPYSKARRTWDNVRCKVRAETLLNGATDHDEPVLLVRVHLGPATGSTPCHSPASVSRWTIPPCAVGMRLGAPIVSSHACVRGKTVTVDGHKVCPVALVLVAIHGTTTSTICCVVPLSQQANCLATREPHSL